MRSNFPAKSTVATVSRESAVARPNGLDCGSSPTEAVFAAGGPHVYSTPAELEAARAKIFTCPWAQAALRKLLGHCAPMPQDGWPGDSAWHLALAGTLAGCEETLRQAVQRVVYVRDIAKECGGSTLAMSWGMNPYMAAFELVRDRLPAGEPDRILSMLRDAAKAIMANNRHDANCQTMHNAALTGVGLLLGEARWVDCAVADETRGLLHHLRRCVRPDGLWWEGSVAYQMEVILAVQMQFEMLRRAGRDLYADPEISGIMKAMYDAPLSLMLSAVDGFAKNDGDISFTLAGWSQLYEIAYTRFHDPRYGWILTQGRRNSPQALLYGELEPLTETPPFASVVLPDSGWAVLRATMEKEADWSGAGMGVMLDFGPHGGWHGHPDALSIAYHAFGEWLLTDQGSSPAHYNNREHWEWYRQTLAHNTVTVDGVPQDFVFGDDDASPEIGSGGRITLAIPDGMIQIVEAVYDPAYPDARYRRAVVAVGAEYLVDFFQVARPGEHVFDYVLHGSGWLTLDQATAPAANRFRPTDQNGGNRGPDAMIWDHARLVNGEWRTASQDPHAAYGYAQDIYACDTDHPLRATFHGGRWGDSRFLSGGASLTAFLLPDGACCVFTCRTPRRHPATCEPTLLARRTGSEANFVAVLAPHRTAGDEKVWGFFAGRSVNLVPHPCAVIRVQPVMAGSDCQGARIVTADGFDVVLHTFNDAARVVLDDPAIRFEGKFCCLRFHRDGRLRAFQVGAGRFLEWSGKLILRVTDGQPVCRSGRLTS